MADARNTNKPSKTSRGGPELGVVRIRYKPAPDAQDRLRRLFTLLVRYATEENFLTPEKDSRSEHGGESET